MAEYVNVPVQEVAVGGNVQFSDEPIRCNKGYIQHRDGSGLFTLRGVTNGCFARYRIFFFGNMAVPTDQTVGEMSLAVTVDGEPLGGSLGAITPTAVGLYGNVAVAAFVDVPRCCCMSVSIRNTSDIPVNVRNANLIIDRVA